MKTYLTSKTRGSIKRFNRIDIFVCGGKYYWSYHNEGTTVETGIDNQTYLFESNIILILCETYNWEYIGEVE